MRAEQYQHFRFAEQEIRFVFQTFNLCLAYIALGNIQIALGGRMTSWSVEAKEKSIKVPNRADFADRPNRSPG